jgi:hypothetical protein
MVRDPEPWRMETHGSSKRPRLLYEAGVDPAQKPAALRALEPLLAHELDAVRTHAAKMREEILG